MKHSSAKPKGYRRRLGRKYRRLAAALAGAFVMTAGGLPGLPAVAHAATPASAAPAAPAVGLKTPKTAKPLRGAAAPVQAQAQQQLNMVATAYAPGAHDNGPWGNKTYLGTQVRPGVIAVDPRVIPLGSRVFIEYPDGRGEYAVAEDTGGAIKGNRIDIAKWTVREAEKFGIQDVKVTIISTPRGV